MGLLAFDRSRLDSLRIAIGAALDDLHGIRSDDTAASDEMIAVRSACRTLGDICLPRVQDILNSDAMTSYQRAKVDGNDIRQVLVYTMSNGYGWEVASDPLDDNPLVVTAEEARALGHRLQHGNLDKLIDHPQETAFIAQQLAIITADPQLRAEFLANMTDLDKLADDYAVARLGLVNELLWNGEVPAMSPTLQAIDDTFAALAQLYLARPSTSHAGPYPAWVEGVEPFTAALLLRYAGLDPTTLGHVANDLLVRWRDTHPDDEDRDQSMWRDFEYRQGPNTADIVFQLLLATTGASTVYVIDAADNPASMWFSADDYQLAQQVALEGTNPANMKAADSGEVIKSFVDFSDNERLTNARDLEVGYPTDYTRFLGALIAPWLLQFSPLNHDWGDDYQRKEGLLATVLEDDSAFAALTSSLQAVVDGLITSAQAGGATTHDIDEYAALTNMLGELIVNHRVHDEEQRRAAWDLWWEVASLPLAWLPGVPGVIADQAVGAAHDAIADRGWAGAPSPDRVKDKAEWELEWMLTAAGAGMAIAACMQLGVSIGTLPIPDETDPHPLAKYGVEFDRWLQANEGDPRVQTVASWKSSFVNAAQVGGAIVP